MTRRIVSKDKVLEKAIAELQEKANKYQAEGDFQAAIKTIQEIETLNARANTKHGTLGDPDKDPMAFLVEAVKVNKAYVKNHPEEFGGEEYSGLVPYWATPALSRQSVNWILRSKFGLSKDEVVELTESACRAGHLEKVRFSYTTKRGERKGAMRLYLTGEAPEASTSWGKDVSGLSAKDLFRS